MEKSNRLDSFARLKRQRWLVQLRYLFVLALISLIAAFAAPFAPAPVLAFDSHLRRYPYLTDVVGPYAAINWATDQSSASGLVRWGRVGTEGCTAHSTSATSTTVNVNGTGEYQWKALLNLTPGAEYCYRVYLGDNPRIDLLDSDQSPHFKAQLPAGSSEPFSFVVFGDWGAVDESGQNPDQANLMARIAASGARFAITTGDNGYPSGSQANYGDLVQIGLNLSGVFGPAFWTVAGASIPLFPALGNHGISSSTVNHPQLLNFPQDRAVATSGGRYVKETYCCLNNTQSTSNASAWYAFDAGVARFYILDSAWSEANVGTASDYQNDYDYHWKASSAERQWLENDLATHPSVLKFAFFHYPLYSDNSTESSDTFLQGPNSLEGLLSRYGVNIAFSGHAHIYQRNRKPNNHSLITYVTGGGGAKVEPIGALGCSAVDAYGIGWLYMANGGAGSGNACGGAPVPTSITRVFHFLLVTVNGAQVTVTPTDSQGQTFDVQTYSFASASDTEPPSAPANLKATAVSTTQVKLAWTAATDNVAVTSYTINRDGAVVATVGGSTLTYTDQGTAPGTTYKYSVAAFDAAGNRSAPSNELVVTTPSVADNTLPSAPANLAVTVVSPTRVDLAWTASTDNVDVIGYTILRDGTVLATVDGNTLTYTDQGTAPGTTYKYSVAAFDAAGNRSAPSNELVVTTPSVADNNPPSAPANLKATPVSATQVNLVWAAATDNVAVTSYTISRDGAVVATVGGSTLTYTDQGTAPGTTYKYSVAAFDAAGNRSAPSPEVSVTTPELVISRPMFVPIVVK